MSVTQSSLPSLEPQKHDGVAPLALLLDVDGPIASPVTRSVTGEVIAQLITLAGAGVPVIFNTGRSDAFIKEQIVEPMNAVGIPEGLTFLAICEKGATWFEFSAGGSTDVQVDSRFTVPSSYGNDVRDLVAEKYSSVMFFDETKLAMVSVEQHVEVPSEDYLAQQPLFDRDALALMPKHAMRGVIRDSSPEQGNGIKDENTRHFLIDPTIISTDIEHARLGKDLGAWRAAEWLHERGVSVAQWRTVGDSGTDYAMADWLHADGRVVAHVDVRPRLPLPEKPYPVLTAASLGLDESVINDVAGLAFLREWVSRVTG